MNLSLFNLLGYASPVLMVLLVAGAMVHAVHASKKASSSRFVFGWKATVLCLLHVLIALGVYWHLVTGGWLYEHYHWDDPNNINLVMALFEGLVILVILMFLTPGKRFAYRLLLDFMIIQLLLAAVAIALILLIVLTWKPGMF